MNFAQLIEPQPKRHKIVGRMVLLVDMHSRTPRQKASTETPERREQRLQRCREWYAANGEYARAKARARHAAKREQNNELKRAYYAKHRARIRAQQSAYYQQRKAA